MNLHLWFLNLLLIFVILQINFKILLMIINHRYQFTILWFLIYIFIYLTNIWRIRYFITSFQILRCKLYSFNVYLLNSLKIILFLKLIFVYFLRIFLHLRFILLFRFLRFKSFSDLLRLQIICVWFGNNLCS